MTSTHKRPLISTLVALAAITTAASASVPLSVTGEWHVHSTFGQNESDSVCTFAQTDARITGKCKSDHGEGKVSGTVDGTKVSWSYESSYNGSPLTLKYAGILDSETHKVAGSVSVLEMGVDGVFSATSSN